MIKATRGLILSYPEIMHNEDIMMQSVHAGKPWLMSSLEFCGPGQVGRARHTGLQPFLEESLHEKRFLFVLPVHL